MAKKISKLPLAVIWFFEWRWTMSGYTGAHIEAVARVLHEERREFVAKSFVGESTKVREGEDLPLGMGPVSTRLPMTILGPWSGKLKAWDNLDEESKEEYRATAISVIDALMDQQLEE